MKRWCDLMAWHVAGPIIKYNDAFFDWLRPQILMIDDYAYVGLWTFEVTLIWFYLRVFSGGT
jgi:hypothetical protein